MKSKVQKWGNSLAVRIPKALATKLGLADDSPVEIGEEGGSLVIRPQVRYSLEELVAQITPENCHAETDWGSPRGKEVW